MFTRKHFITLKFNLKEMRSCEWYRRYILHVLVQTVGLQKQQPVRYVMNRVTRDTDLSQSKDFHSTLYLSLWKHELLTKRSASKTNTAQCITRRIQESQAR